MILEYLMPAGASFSFATRTIHGTEPSEDHFGAIVDPIYMTSTYGFDSLKDAADVLAGESDRYIYGRHHNPTQEVLERRLAELDGAQAALVLASGIAAISTTLLTLLSAGDEIIVHRTMYSNAMLLLEEALPRLGIKVVAVNLADPAMLQQALSSATKLVYFESLVNPTCAPLDIEALARIAHARGAKVVVDSTFLSPALQRPIEHGADIVVHSLTKYINGHGDVLGGVVLGERAIIEQLRTKGLKYITGATLSPMHCFLVLRGLKTLSLRMRQHSASALRIAEMLSTHSAVESVSYPFLPSDPGNFVARKQMLLGGGMLSFCLKTGIDGANKFVARLRLIRCAVSLGDVASLITQPGTLLRGRQKIDSEARLAPDVPLDLIRLSVGLEDTEDLLNDLCQALKRL